MTQPTATPDVHREMGPVEIARSRLVDVAQGAMPELFSRYDAELILQRLNDFEARYDALRGAVHPLLTALDQVEILGPMYCLAPLIRARDNAAQELNLT